MTNRMQVAAARLERRRQQYAGVTVLYARGTVTRSVTAEIGSTPYTQENASGITIGLEHRDWLIVASELATFWTQVTGDPEPSRGDQILDGDAVYEVMSLPNEPPYRMSGGYGQTYRIHTKRVGDG